MCGCGEDVDGTKESYGVRADVLYAKHRLKRRNANEKRIAVKSEFNQSL